MDSRLYYNDLEEGIRNLCCIILYQILNVLIVSVIQLPLPDSLMERMYHSLSAIQLSPQNVLLVAFGGQRSFGGNKLSHTAVIELSEYHSTSAAI